MDVLKQTIKQWFEDDTTELAAAFSFYAIFLVGPVLLLAIVIAGFAFGEQAAEGEIVSQIDSIVGNDAAQAIESMIESAGKATNGILATLFSLGFVVYLVFRMLWQAQKALNKIWHVEPKDSIFSLEPEILKQRAIAFGIVVVMSSIVLALVVLNTFLPWVLDSNEYLVDANPTVYRVVGTLLTLVLLSVLIATIYKLLPDVQISWQDVWLGAFATSVLIIVGNILILYYLRHSSTVSAFGVAGSVIALMLWIYYVSQVFFLGAEFTQAYAEHYGEDIQPDEYATWVHQAAGKG